MNCVNCKKFLKNGTTKIDIMIITEAGETLISFCSTECRDEFETKGVLVYAK